MKELPVHTMEKMLGLKLLVLSAVVLSLTLAKPAAMAAHQGAQRVCSFIMLNAECSKHC